MNRRQKKKFRKKGNFKKYGTICMMRFNTNEDGTTDLIRCKFHNGSRKILEAYKYTNVYPVACSSDLEYTDNNNVEITTQYTLNMKSKDDLPSFSVTNVDDYLNKWKEGLKDDSSEK